MSMTSENQISPKLPVISIYKNRGVEIINLKTIKYFEKATAYSLIQDSSDAEMYSNEMEVWNLEQKTDKFKNTKWNRFLAKTVYSHSFDVTIHWKRIRPYKLDELKTKINN